MLGFYDSFSICKYFFFLHIIIYISFSVIFFELVQFSRYHEIFIVRIRQKLYNYHYIFSCSKL